MIAEGKTGADLTNDDWILVLVTAVDNYRKGNPQGLKNIASILKKVGEAFPELKI